MRLDLELVCELMQQEIYKLRAEKKAREERQTMRGATAYFQGATGDNEDLVAKTFIPPKNLTSEPMGSSLDSVIKKPN